MKVTILEGSPRKKGNTAKILEWVKTELESMDHDVESIYLNTKDIHGCLACAKCKDKPDVIGCVQKDDAYDVFSRMIESQLVIYSSPLYFWGVSAQLKALIDRSYCLYTDANTPKHASLIDGVKQAILVTGAGPYENNAEGVFQAFDRMMKYHKSIKAGELFIGGCTAPDNMDELIKAQALEFTRNIISA